jgi:hypothetical protein
MENQLKVAPGRSFKLRHPGTFEIVKLHVDFVLDNPTSDLCYNKLVVCRRWLKHKKRWSYDVFPYYVLAIHNDWKYRD